MRLHCFFLLIFFATYASAKLAIPKNLVRSDRQILLETLGPSTTMKVLGDPYPLGGYMGLEFGVSNEIIASEGVSRLGARASQHSETSYTMFSFGKGLYNNFDFFIQFAPLGQSEEVSNYGGQMRWGFYQAEYLPTYLSLVISANSVNYQDLLTINSQAVDLINGFAVDDLSFYIGLGSIQSQGTFIGGAGGITSEGDTQQENLSTGHYLVGLNLKFQKAFLALQLDRTVQPTYSLKVGARF